MTKKSNNKKLSWVSKILLVVNVVSILALLVSYLSPNTHPETNITPALLALIFPLLIIINLLFVIYWVIRLRYFFLFSLVALAVGYNYMARIYSHNSENPVGSYDKAIKLVSYNVRLFDQYKWTGNQNYFTRNSVFDFIHSEQADIICIQEFFHGSEKSFPTVGPFLEKTQAKNYHLDYVKVVGDSKHYGLATFTALPIVGKGSIRFEGATSNSGIYTDVLFNEDTIRVFNFHLESVRFSKSDYKFVSEVIDPAVPVHSSSSKVIVRKLSTAFKRRAKQAETAKSYIDASPYPVIVCGDFNDTPLSYVYETISDGLKDAFMETGNGFGSSYAGGLPFLRIDYILYSDELQPYRFKKHNVSYSDHYPLSCYFKIK